MKILQGAPVLVAGKAVTCLMLYVEPRVFVNSKYTRDIPPTPPCIPAAVGYFDTGVKAAAFEFRNWPVG